MDVAPDLGPQRAWSLTIVERLENLRPSGDRVLWQGAQDILFEEATVEQ